MTVNTIFTLKFYYNTFKRPLGYKTPFKCRIKCQRFTKSIKWIMFMVELKFLKSQQIYWPNSSPGKFGEDKNLHSHLNRKNDVIKKKKFKNKSNTNLPEAKMKITPMYSSRLTQYMRPMTVDTRLTLLTVDTRLTLIQPANGQLLLADG